MSRVFVTGATGMLGCRLVERLLEEGHRVRALVRGPNASRLPAGAERVAGDLDDPDALARAMEGCDRVFHVAGQVSYRARDAASLYRANVLGTRHVMAAALEAGVRRVVHTSSTAAIGLSDTPRVLDESASFDSRFRAVPYMWTKHLAEVEVEDAVGAGLDAVIVNPSTLVGAGDVYRSNGRVYEQLARGSIRAAPPGGNSVVALEDAVGGHLLAMERGTAGRRYILSAENLTNLEMLSRISRIVGRPPIRRELPRWTERPLAAAAWLVSRLGGSALTPQVVFFSYRFRWFDASRARAELGWSPAWSFEDAARDAWRWYSETSTSPPAAPPASHAARARATA